MLCLVGQTTGRSFLLEGVRAVVASSSSSPFLAAGSNLDAARLAKEGESRSRNKFARRIPGTPRKYFAQRSVAELPNRTTITEAAARPLALPGLPNGKALQIEAKICSGTFLPALPTAFRRTVAEAATCA